MLNLLLKVKPELSHRNQKGFLEVLHDVTPSDNLKINEVITDCFIIIQYHQCLYFGPIVFLFEEEQTCDSTQTNVYSLWEYACENSELWTAELKLLTNMVIIRNQATDETKTATSFRRMCKCTNLHICIAQTCIPSTSSLHAVQCDSHVPSAQLRFPLHWCKVCPWTWWLPATSPLASHKEWSAA